MGLWSPNSLTRYMLLKFPFALQFMLHALQKSTALSVDDLYRYYGCALTLTKVS